MTDIMSGLYAFWSQFGVPAYLRDCVPDDAVLPYITYEVSKSEAMNASILTAFNWHDREPAGNRDRSELADRVANAISASGVRLNLDNGGFLVIRRNPADFQTPYQDPSDAAVIAIRTSCEVYYYTM